MARLRTLLSVVLVALAGRASAEVALFHELGLAVAFPTGAAFSASYAPTLALFGDRLRLGAGPRVSAYLDGDAVPYPNGDAALLDAAAGYALTVPRPRTFAVNLMATASIRVVAGLELGANIDLVGVGFGPSRTGTYAGADPSFAGAQAAGPSPFNLLLLGRHDRGQLDSEFFVAYWWERWGVRAGLSHMSTEYTTDRTLDAGNDRFRASATRFFAALGYRIR